MECTFWDGATVGGIDVSQTRINAEEAHGIGQTHEIGQTHGSAPTGAFFLAKIRYIIPTIGLWILDGNGFTIVFNRKLLTRNYRGL